MIIEIVNKNNGRKARFFDLPSWNNNGHPICSVMPHNYEQHIFDYKTSDNIDYILNNYSGFFDNNKVVSWTRNGIAVNGQVFKTNNFENKTIQWNFIPAFYGTVKEGSSANFLNSVLMSKNTPLTVNVYTSQNIFTQDFYVGEETSTESGVIQMISAYDGDGIYWHDQNSIIRTATKYANDNYEPKRNPYIIKKLEYIPLHKKGKNLVNNNQLRLLVDTTMEATVIKIKVGNLNTQINGQIVIDNKLTGEQMTITPVSGDKYFIIDPIAKTVVNQNGVNRVENTNKVFPWLDSGRNELIVSFKGQSEILDDNVFQIEYFNNYTAIF